MRTLKRTGAYVSSNGEDLIARNLCDPGAPEQTLLLQHREAVFVKLINLAGVSLL